MKVEISFQFLSASAANRFINELKHWHLHEVQAKLNKQSNQVKVGYEYASKDFDYTSSDLDDLAAHYNGHEV